MLASVQVIGHRSNRMLSAGSSPDAGQRREFALMGQEEIAAASESAQAMALSWIKLNQELFASMPVVRREAVSAAAGKLQASGLIHSSRGKISVLDRAKLEAHVCECYSLVKREYDRLLSPDATLASVAG